MAKLRVQFLTDDENNRFHIGGRPGIDIARFADYWGIGFADALTLYGKLYSAPRFVSARSGERLDELFRDAERAIGMPVEKAPQRPRRYDFLIGADGNIYRFEDSCMRLAKLYRYFTEDQVSDIYIRLKNLAREVLPRQKGMRFYINPEQNAPHSEPHVHVVDSSGLAVSLRINDGTDLTKGQSGFPKKKMREAQKIIRDHDTELLDDWRRLADGIVRLTDDSLGPAIIEDFGPTEF